MYKDDYEMLQSTYIFLRKLQRMTWKQLILYTREPKIKTTNKLFKHT